MFPQVLRYLNLAQSSLTDIVSRMDTVEITQRGGSVVICLYRVTLGCSTT